MSAETHSCTPELSRFLCPPPPPPWGRSAGRAGTAKPSCVQCCQVPKKFPASTSKKFGQQLKIRNLFWKFSAAPFLPVFGKISQNSATNFFFCGPFWAFWPEILPGNLATLVVCGGAPENWEYLPAGPVRQGKQPAGRAARRIPCRTGPAGIEQGGRGGTAESSGQSVYSWTEFSLGW